VEDRKKVVTEKSWVGKGDLEGKTPLSEERRPKTLGKRPGDSRKRWTFTTKRKQGNTDRAA